MSHRQSKRKSYSQSRLLARSRWVAVFLLAFSLFASSLVNGWMASPEEARAGGRQTGPIGVTDRPGGGVDNGRKDPLDEPIRLLRQGLQTYSQVRDYTCTMVKQERVNGTMQTENVIRMKFRETPFSVHLAWAGPKDLVGQEVAYVQGQNRNNMRVRQAGGLLGRVVLSISPDAAMARAQSRHTIKEAGIRNLASRCLRDWQSERGTNLNRVRIAEYVFDKRKCYRVDVARTKYTKDAYGFRTVLYLDKQTKLPLRAEIYDWPRQGGNPSGDLMEVYSYLGLRFNNRLTDQDFVVR